LVKETETALYRIVQEALTNAAKHSAAKFISIDLIEQQGEIILTVLDDGKGCNLARVSPNQGSRFGLLGMAERARMIGARISMKSRPGEGFYLQVTLPLEKISV
jgi:signal transduction histidine kinase